MAPTQELMNKPAMRKNFRQVCSLAQSGKTRSFVRKHTRIGAVTRVRQLQLECSLLALPRQLC
eukprot:2356834-Pyramimonas_sp.AAC.1